MWVSVGVCLWLVLCVKLYDFAQVPYAENQTCVITIYKVDIYILVF